MKIAENYPQFVKEDVTGCFLWTGPTCAEGRYGRVVGFPKLKMAHRLSYELEYGEIQDGLYVCHKCDVKLCVNPDHFFLGTHTDNIRDALSKGLMSNGDQKGSNNNNAKPNYEERNLGIRDARLGGKTYSQIKIEFDLKSNGHLRNILKSFGL